MEVEASCHGDGLIKHRQQPALTLLRLQRAGRAGRRGSCHVGMEREKVTPAERDKSLVCKALELSLGALRVEGNGRKEPSSPRSLGCRTSSW